MGVRTITLEIVVWLGESQYYLGGTASRSHRRSTTFCATRAGCRHILGRLWPEHLSDLTAGTVGITDPQRTLGSC